MRGAETRRTNQENQQQAARAAHEEQRRADAARLRAADAERRQEQPATWAAGHLAWLLGEVAIPGSLLAAIVETEADRPHWREGFQRSPIALATLTGTPPDDVACALAELDASDNGDQRTFAARWTTAYPVALTTLPTTLRWIADVLDAYAVLATTDEAAADDD